jgi:hypothetical protein
MRCELGEEERPGCMARMRRGATAAVVKGASAGHVAGL